MITHPDIVAHLSKEDLMRWRAIMARAHGISLNPTAYSKEETEQHVSTKMATYAEFTVSYNLVDSPAITILESTGAIYYTDNDGRW